MAAVTLPLTFQNSFWSQDYRTGLEVLFNQLEKVRVEQHRQGVFYLISLRPSAGHRTERGNRSLHQGKCFHKPQCHFILTSFVLQTRAAAESALATALTTPDPSSEYIRVSLAQLGAHRF